MKTALFTKASLAFAARVAPGSSSIRVPRSPATTTTQQGRTSGLVRDPRLLPVIGFGESEGRSERFIGAIRKKPCRGTKVNTAFRWCALAFLAVPLAAAAAPDLVTRQMLENAVASVVPAGGYQSRIVLGDSIVKLVREGVLEPKKLGAIYARRAAIPEDLRDAIGTPSYQPIRLTRRNAGAYVNALWPLGLANWMAANKFSPLNGPSRMTFASTGGWNLGREKNGGVYFNSFPIVRLTERQEALVVKVARHTYRPCCNNSTFFQDCNHGSALLGLLALGAAQGLTETELYREALAFSAFWFPSDYIETAVYFKTVRNTRWQDVNAREVMSAEFSSASGWQKNVARELARRGLLPAQGGANCSA